MKVAQSTKSSRGCALIKTDDEQPLKVLVEKNSLGIPVEVHSFYWPYELIHRLHDYEPIAFGTKEKFCLSRVHFHGLVIWKDYNLKKKLPIIYFGPEFHTPFLCAPFEAHFVEPVDIISKMTLKGYFLRIHNKRRVEFTLHYRADDYDEKIVDEDVPRESIFDWTGINYFVLISRSRNLKELDIDENIKKRIKKAILDSKENQSSRAM